jgi:hypothetical protein
MTRNANEERRRSVPLTEEQVAVIAELAKEKAIEQMTAEFYTTVGKTVVSKILWVIGVISMAFYLWLKKQGIPGFW